MCGKTDDEQIYSQHLKKKMDENTDSLLKLAMNGLWSTKNLVCGKSSLVILHDLLPHKYQQNEWTK